MTLPELSMRWSLPKTAASVSVARGLAVGILRGWGYDEALAQDVRYIVSELVTNAVLHANSARDVVLRVSGFKDEGIVRVEVTDLDSALPKPAEPTADGESGRGLFLVSSLSLTSGWKALPGGGKRAWAELKAPFPEHVQTTPVAALLDQDRPPPAHSAARHLTGSARPTGGRRRPIAVLGRAAAPTPSSHHLLGAH